MKDRKKKDAPPGTTPFFARYLEGQTNEDAEAKVTERAGRPSATAKKSAKKSAGKKSSGTQAAAASPRVTLKYPSDNDEYIYFPYHVEAATKGPGKGAQTLKYPSDNDEEGGVYALYADEADAPKAGAKAKAKDAQVRLTRKVSAKDR